MQTKLTKSIALTFVISLLAGICAGQSDKFPNPREERLLNDLNVLIWKRNDAKKLSVSLRVHSGSAFDPVGKEGTAKLLTEVMFPNTGIFENFEEDLGGSLEVSSTFDYLQIDITAAPDKLVEVLGILAAAVTAPQIDTTTTGEAKKARLLIVEERSEDPSYIADAETAERLYGSFPYGRRGGGSVESIHNIDFADLIFAKQRFLTADNATLVVSGDVDTSFVYRAARRLLGGWKKGNGRVPSNFTVPETPDSAPLVVNTDFGVGVEERLAVDAVSRRAKDHYAARLLTRVLDARLANKNGGSVVYSPFYLRGYIKLSQMAGRETNGVPESSEADSLKTVTPANLLAELLSKKVKLEEFEAAKTAEIASFKSYDIVRHWFDVDTYQLLSVEDEYKKLQNVTLGDVNSFATKIAEHTIVHVDVQPLDKSAPASDKDPDDPR